MNPRVHFNVLTFHIPLCFPKDTSTKGWQCSYGIHRAGNVLKIGRHLMLYVLQLSQATPLVGSGGDRDGASKRKCASRCGYRLRRCPRHPERGGGWTWNEARSWSAPDACGKFFLDWKPNLRPKSLLLDFNVYGALEEMATCSLEKSIIKDWEWRLTYCRSLAR